MGILQFEQRTNNLSFKDAMSSGLGLPLLPEDEGGAGSITDTTSKAALRAKLLL